MADISKIGQTFGVNYVTNDKKKSQKQQEQLEDNLPQRAKTDYKDADEVLSFMAKTCDFNEVAENKAKSGRTIEVSKYVTPEQAKRIAGFVMSFEGAVEKGLKAFEEEFGHLSEVKNMSESAKLATVASAFTLQNLG